MSLEFDDRGLVAQQQQIAQAPSRIERRFAGRTIQATRELLKVARQVVHRRSGRLRDSLVVDGPYPVAGGGVEARVRATVPYAAREVSHGGAHDYPTRTLETGQPILDALTRDLVLIVIEETGAGQG